MTHKIRNDFESLGANGEWEKLRDAVDRYHESLDNDESVASVTESNFLLKKKDVIVLRLYVNFLRTNIPGRESTWPQVSALTNLANEGDDRAFLSALSHYFKSIKGTIGEALDPDTNFSLSNENKEKLKELLVRLQQEKVLQEEASIGPTDASTSFGSAIDQLLAIQVLTSILFEALQLMNIIPNQTMTEMETEVDELRQVIAAFNNIKNNLIDYKNIVA